MSKKISIISYLVWKLSSSVSDAQYTFIVLYFKLIFLTGLLENYLLFIYDFLVHFSSYFCAEFTIREEFV